MNIWKLQGIKSTHRIPCNPIQNNEKTEREIKETIPFTTGTKGIKYWDIYVPKETKALYTENHKTLIKKSKRAQIDGEIYHVHGLE